MARVKCSECDGFVDCFCEVVKNNAKEGEFTLICASCGNHKKGIGKIVKGLGEVVCPFCA